MAPNFDPHARATARFDPLLPGRVLAMVPAFNEAPRIGDVVRGALVHLPVLVVDAGSTDATAAEAAAAGASVLDQRPNQGKVRRCGRAFAGRSSGASTRW